MGIFPLRTAYNKSFLYYFPVISLVKSDLQWVLLQKKELLRSCYPHMPLFPIMWLLKLNFAVDSVSELLRTSSDILVKWPITGEKQACIPRTWPSCGHQTYYGKTHMCTCMYYSLSLV